MRQQNKPTAPSSINATTKKGVESTAGFEKVANATTPFNLTSANSLVQRHELTNTTENLVVPDVITSLQTTPAITTQVHYAQPHLNADQYFAREVDLSLAHLRSQHSTSVDAINFKTATLPNYVSQQLPVSPLQPASTTLSTREKLAGRSLRIEQFFPRPPLDSETTNYKSNGEDYSKTSEYHRHHHGDLKP